MNIQENNSQSFFYRHRFFLIFVIFFAIYSALAYHLVFNLHHAFGDAVTRTEKPFLVLYDNEPKLAAIGFIWPPLPSLLQLPMIAIFKRVAMYGFAGKLLTAFFGALNVVLIYLFLEKIQTKGWFKAILLLGYGLNPMIVFYAINGMSETTFLFFVIMVAWNFYQWQNKYSFYNLLLMGFALAGAFLTRYETFGLLTSVGGLVFLTSVFFNKSLFTNITFNERIRYGINMATFTLLPVIFTIGIWMFVNWIIMGDPLHFFHGEYSVSEQSNLIGGEASETSHHLKEAIYYSYKRILFLFPFSSLLAVLILLPFRKYSWKVVSMLLLALTIPAFEILMHFLGKSYGWLRFFMYVIPFSFILLSVYANKYKIKSIYFFMVSIILLIASSFFSLKAMLNPVYGKEESSAVKSLLENKESVNKSVTYDIDMDVVRYLQQILKPKEKVLVDDFIGFSIILNYGDPKVFVNNSDKGFDEAVKNPRGTVDYILIPSPNFGGVATLDIFNKTYPDMYNKGAEYLELVKTIDDYWRLYKIKK